MILTADNFASPSPASDGDLLARYARLGDQQAFRDLVRRHIDWLYAAALRITHDTALAEDVTQGVLLALSRKAPALAHRTVLAGWLFQATRYGAVSLVRAESRRKERERMHARTLSAQAEAPAWDDLKDRLDHAVGRLPSPDREALILRFFQRLSHEDIAVALGISEAAARKRVTRALERLRHALGVAAPASALGGSLTNIPTVTAPAHLLHGVLAGTVSVKAALIAKGVSLMGITAKLKLALAVSALVVFTGYLAGTYALGQGAPRGDAGAPAATSTRVTVSGSAGGGGGGGSGGSGFGWGSGGSGGSGGTSVSGSGSAMSSWSDGTTSGRRFSDGTHDITLTTTAGATTALIKDAAGNVVFNGPYTTDADKAKLPADLADKVSRLASPPTGMMGMPGVPMGRGMGMNPGTPLSTTPGRPSLAAVKIALAATDDQWAALDDKVQRVLTLQGYLSRTTTTVVPAPADPDNPLLAPTQDLEQSLKDPNAASAALADKVTAVRAARKIVQDKLTTAQKALDAAANARHRATLIQLGVLE